MNSLTETGKRARAASRVLACTTTGQRNAALTAIGRGARGERGGGAGRE